MMSIYNFHTLFNKKDISKRLNLLDELRGAAIILMVMYHLFYSAGFLFSMNWGMRAYIFTTPIEPFIAITFILISGVCCSLSKNNLLRGLKLAVISVIVTLVTVIFTPGSEIYYGVLFLLSSSMIICGILEKPLGRIPHAAGAIVSFVLYLLLWGVPHGYLGVDFLRLGYLPSELYSTNFLAFLGLPGAGFHSADYFPLIPHFFLFLGGCFLGRIGKEKGFPEILKPLRVRPLAFLGRHSLGIYVIHQPLIVGILYLFTLILPSVI